MVVSCDEVAGSGIYILAREFPPFVGCTYLTYRIWFLWRLFDSFDSFDISGASDSFDLGLFVRVVALSSSRLDGIRDSPWYSVQIVTFCLQLRAHGLCCYGF